MWRGFMAIVAVAIMAAHSPADEMILAEGGQSGYRIVVAEAASASTRHAAEELQMFLREIAGATLPQEIGQRHRIERGSDRITNFHPNRPGFTVRNQRA